MSILVLRFAAPLQSWGGYRHGVNKESAAPTAAMPSKSGISGLIGAALGRRDLDTISGQFRLHVRLDSTGPVAEDFQTIGPLPGFLGSSDPGGATRVADRSTLVATAGNKTQIERKRDGGNFLTAISRKEYLAHSEFLVAVETAHAAEWLAALREPVFMPYLGRKSCAPSFPFVLGTWSGGVSDLFSQAPCAVSGYASEEGLRSYEIVGDYNNHIETSAALHHPEAASREDYLSWATTHLER